MIELPRRSVTRFFIPLIDVLTLLFCIFLVLPLAKDSGDGTAKVDAAEESLRQQERELERLRGEIEQIRRDKGKELQKRLAVRVLEIDGDNGNLYYRDPERVPISDEAAAHALIEADRRRWGPKELYYLILYPRSRTSTYPTGGQRSRYDRWFEGVALGKDIPSESAKGRQP